MADGADLINDIIAKLGVLTPETKEGLTKTTFAVKASTKRFFTPNPGPQTLAYFSEADEVFFGGGGGGGKSTLICGLAVDSHTNSHLFRREATQAQGLVEELVKIIGNSAGLNNSQPAIWRLPGTDKIITIAGVKDEKDKEKWQGRAGDLKGFDEITHFTRTQYTFIIGWNRTTKAGQRCRVIVAGNPPVSEEGLWVIQYWAPWLDEDYHDPAEPGELRWACRRTDDAADDDELFFRTQEQAIAHMLTLASAPRDHTGQIIPPRSRTFIPATVEDNPDLMRSGYQAVLEGMPKELRDAMRHGKFKKSFADADGQVIATDWILAAQDRWRPEPPPDVPMTNMGVDIAQGGADNTIISSRHDTWFAEQITRPGKETPDGRTAAALVFMHMRDNCHVTIDCGGGWGNSAYEILDEANLDILGFVPSAGSMGRTLDGKLKFINLRAEAIWRLREALDPTNNIKIALPKSAALRSDLAAYRWKLTTGAAIQIESKIEMKKRLGRSPDYGDAAVLSWFVGGFRTKSAMRPKRGVARKLQSTTNVNRTRDRYGRAKPGNSNVGSSSDGSDEMG
jgi:hypothetical protein